MKTYHRTTLENWEKVQAEGALWGVRTDMDTRVTYLSYDREDAAGWADNGAVLLEVEFDPEVDKPNNHMEGAWQCRVYVPIPMDRVKRIE